MDYAFLSESPRTAITSIGATAVSRRRVIRHALAADPQPIRSQRRIASVYGGFCLTGHYFREARKADVQV